MLQTEKNTHGVYIFKYKIAASGSPAQEGHQPVGMSLAESHQID